MALSGSFENAASTTGGGVHYKLRVVWNATPDMVNNTSTIVCDFYLVQDPWYNIIFGVKSNTCVIDGTTVTWSSIAVSNSSINEQIITKLGSCSHTVKHNEDGSKKLTITATYAVDKMEIGNDNYTKIVASAEITLDSIIRGLVNIDTGSGFVKAIPYIDNGTEWKQCIPYIDNGSEFKMCSG